MNLMWAIFEPIIIFVGRKLGELIGFIIGSILQLIWQFIKLTFEKIEALFGVGTHAKTETAPPSESDKERFLQEQSERQARHRILANTLSDEFAMLDTSLTGIIRSASRAERSTVIDKFGGTATPLSAGASEMLLNSGTDWKRGAIKGALTSGATCNISRPVADLSEKEILILKTLSLMNSLMLVDNEHLGLICMIIIFNGGNCLLETNFMDIPYIHQAIQELVKNKIHAPIVGLQQGIATIGEVRRYLNENDPELLAEVDREMGGKNGWLKVSSL